MRTEQDQLIDLTKEILTGIRNIRIRRHIKYAYPIILEGKEGVILRNLLELICAGDRDKPNTDIAGSLWFEKSPVLCSEEFPLPGFDEIPVTRK